MRFPTRRTARSEAGGPAGRAEATYAAIVDRVLWVATAAPEPLVLAPVADGAEIGPDELDAQPGHHGSRFELARLPEGVDHVLRTAAGHPVPAPEVRAVAAGAAYALTRDDDHHLHVVRRPVPAGPTLRAARLDADRVQLSLQTTGRQLGVHDGDDTVLTRTLDDQGTVELGAEDLRLLAPGERTLRLLVDGAPVRRRANDLADPGAGVPLPALHSLGAPAPRARLRWSSEATLVLRLIEPSPGEPGR